MALTEELRTILDNEEEPLPKRLKVADNVFKSPELPIQHREAILLKWLGKATKTNDKEVWALLLSWLKSQQMRDLNRNEISREDIKSLMNVITKRMKNQQGEDLEVTLNCVIALLENRNFQLCFKHDLEGYCKFTTNVLCKIENVNGLHLFLTNEQLFNRNLIGGDEFYEIFIENTLESLAMIYDKFSNDRMIFEDITKLVEKCLFHRNFKNFSTYLKMFFEEATEMEETPPALPKLFLKSLKNLYTGENVHPKFVYRIIFHSYCSSYSNNFEIVYKFLILLTETLGFDLVSYFNLNKIKKFQNSSPDLDKSIEILTELCQVLINNDNNLNFKINEKSFTEFLENLTLTIITSTKPNKSVYEFLNCIIILDPLIIEKILNSAVVYTMLSNKKSTLAQYEKFLTSVFEVFSKLHRIPNLISKMIRTIKTALEGSFNAAVPTLQFLNVSEVKEVSEENAAMTMMPTAVLNYFTQCIATLASWQVINLFKTLLFHLETAVNDLTTIVDVPAKISYVELISTLTCQFLSSVRIAEHTVTTVVVEKFVKTMDELKGVLGKFGNALVNMEHNPTLMGAYLNICYAWGELYVTLAYYSINNEVTLQKTLDIDSSACNITYLHLYLTRDQWCLISQRITNFGEKPCKQIMQKLYIQKLKAMFLFEENVNEEVISSIRTSISSTIEDNWKDIVFDQLVLNKIISKSDKLVQMAELILQDVIDTNNYQQLKLLVDCDEVVSSLLFVCVVKLNKAFKRKHKHKQTAVRTPLCSKVVPYITEDLFLNQAGNNESLQEFLNVFAKELALEAERSEVGTIASVNEKDLLNYMNIVKMIPVVQCCLPNVHIVLHKFLIAVLLDLRCSAVHNVELTDKCESIIIGLGQNYPGSFETVIQQPSLIKILINNFKRYLDIFQFITRNIFKNEDNLVHLKKLVDFLTENISQEKYLQCSLVGLNDINKYKKSKFSVENKNLLIAYQEEIFKSILELIVKEKDTDDVLHLMEAYALTLKHYLSKSSDELNRLLPLLEKYIKAATNDTETTDKHTRGTILLFTTILRNKSKINTLEEDIVLKVWSYCQNLKPGCADYEDYSKLVMLVFEHIPNEQFSAISSDLLKLMEEAIKEDPKRFTEQLKMWNAILGCDFNQTKNGMWQKVLASLLLEIILVYLKDDKQMARADIYEDVVKLEINIIQNLHLLLTGPLMEALLLTVSIITSSTAGNFKTNFTLCISLLETLLKYRNAVTMDYLPPYLQQYRALLTKLCAKSNSNLKLEETEIQQVADCAHKLEKLTNVLVACNRPIVRISPYLIADILKQYEEITLYPNVKIHLNNCLYSLISLCDQHAISYIMRILSTASTEMFKVIYENYKKYYKYTGKV